MYICFGTVVITVQVAVFIHRHTADIYNSIHYSLSSGPAGWLAITGSQKTKASILVQNFPHKNSNVQ